MATSVAALNRSVEACIESHPEQYQWEYKRFKGMTIDGRKAYSKLNP
nr:hypothetical protein [Oleiphilus sp. HI0117]